MNSPFEDVIEKGVKGLLDEYESVKKYGIRIE